MVSKYTMPFSVENGDKVIKIRNDCDFRVVLDCIEVSKDMELQSEERTAVTLNIFYENIEDITNFDEAVNDMIAIIENSDNSKKQHHSEDKKNEPEIVDFNIDFDLYISGVNKILGYDCRNPNKFTHWWTFLSAYKEIGDGYFAQVVGIRKKRYIDHKPLDKTELEFYNNNRDDINAIYRISDEDEAYLNEDL